MTDHSASGPSWLITPAGYQGRLGRSDDQLAALNQLRAETAYAGKLEFHLLNILAAVEGLRSTGIPTPSLNVLEQALHTLLPDHDALEKDMADANRPREAESQYEYSLLITPPGAHREAFFRIRKDILPPFDKELANIRITAPYVEPLRAFAATVSANLNGIADALNTLEQEYSRYARLNPSGRPR